MFKLKASVLGLAALSTLALAAGNYSMIINGQVAQGQAIVVGGQTYVPLSALKALGIPTSLKGTTLTLGAQAPATAPGGSNQRASLEGCIGETLFNGIWRLTTRKVEPIGAEVGLGPGWGVTVELRNGTTTKTNLHDTGLTAIELVQPDGNTFSFQERAAEEYFIYKDVTQAGGVTYQLKFHVPLASTPVSSVPRPTKLVVQIDPRRVTAGYVIAGRVAYTTSTPSFRVRLDCTK